MTTEPESTPSVSEEVVTVRVRRSPKYSVFLVLGAVVGVLVAMILTFAFNGTALPSPNTTIQYTQLQVFGFIVLWCVPAGMVLAGVIALILDRVVGRRTREVRFDHETVRGDG